MNYVKSFDLFGVEAKQIPCIEFNSRPTDKTIGAVGMLGIDTTHMSVYKCVNAKDGVYNWERIDNVKPNLFNDKDCVAGYLDSNGKLTNPSDLANEKTSDYIEIFSSKYNIQAWFPKSANSTPWMRVGYYDENCVLLSTSTYSGVGTYNIVEDTKDGGKYQCVKVIIPSGCKYIRFSARTYSNALIKFEEGWEMTAFCPYEEFNANDKVSDYDYIVKSINHRGLNTVAPENTLSAYKASAKAGFKYVETDIAWTLDGVPVLLHDATVDRTSNGTGSIKNFTLAQIKELDFGSWFSPKFTGEKIPTFDEFIKLCKNLGLHPYIQLAGLTQEYLDDLLFTLKKYGMLGNVTWISFSANILNTIKSNCSNARLGYCVSDITEDIINSAIGLKTDDNEVFIDCVFGNLTEEKVNMCINLDIPLEVYTITSHAHIRDIHPYITGMTTDFVNCGKVKYYYTMKRDV